MNCHNPTSSTTSIDLEKKTNGKNGINLNKIRNYENNLRRTLLNVRQRILFGKFKF